MLKNIYMYAWFKYWLHASSKDEKNTLSIQLTTISYCLFSFVLAFLFLGVCVFLITCRQRNCKKVTIKLKEEHRGAIYGYFTSKSSTSDLSQAEAKCKATDIKMICLILMRINFIFTRKVLHFKSDGFCN